MNRLTEFVSTRVDKATRERIDRIARCDEITPATVARRLILAGLRAVAGEEAQRTQ